MKSFILTNNTILNHRATHDMHCNLSITKLPNKAIAIKVNLNTWEITVTNLSIKCFTILLRYCSTSAQTILGRRLWYKIPLMPNQNSLGIRTTSIPLTKSKEQKSDFLSRQKAVIVCSLFPMMFLGSITY